MLTKARIKHLQSLKLKKYRQNYAEFIIEGDKLITEALLGKAELMLLMATKKWFENNTIRIPEHLAIEELEERELEKLSSLKTPQSVIALVKAPVNTFENSDFNKEWVIVLDGINDPGNLGTIIRSADWFGVKIVVCSEDCVELYNPKVIQASMGSLFRVKVMYTDISPFLRKSTQKKYAATLDGSDINSLQFDNPGILVIGNESHGIREEIIELCDQKISIPRIGKAESLNAAVAAAILLSKIVGNR